MKNFVVTVCLCVVLVFIASGCVSTGGDARPVIGETSTTGGDTRSVISEPSIKETATLGLFWLGGVEKSQPRFSSDGQEYIKVSIVEAVRQSRNPANRDKKLFFETSEVMVKFDRGSSYTHYVSSFSEPGEVGMTYFGDAVQGEWRWFSAVLYRVRCYEFGANFSIDSFIE